MACKPIQEKIQKKYRGKAVLRMSNDKAVSSKFIYICVKLQIKRNIYFFVLRDHW